VPAWPQAGIALKRLVEADADYDITLINGEPPATITRNHVVARFVRGKDFPDESSLMTMSAYKIYTMSKRALGCFVTRTLTVEKRTVKPMRARLLLR